MNESQRAGLPLPFFAHQTGAKRANLITAAQTSADDELRQVPASEALGQQFFGKVRLRALAAQPPPPPARRGAPNIGWPAK